MTSPDIIGTIILDREGNTLFCDESFACALDVWVLAVLKRRASDICTEKEKFESIFREVLTSGIREVKPFTLCVDRRSISEGVS